MSKQEPPSSDSEKRLLLPAVTLSRKDLTRRMRRVEGATVRHARKFILQRLDRAREVRRHIAIWIVLVAYVIAATALQLTWYQQGYRTTAGAAGGTYAEAVEGPLDTLNPLFAQSGAEQAASRLLFSSLMAYDTTGNLNYDLASNLQIDETQKIYTVSLRDDAFWHDGKPVIAADVAFTIGLINSAQVHSTISSFGAVTVAAIDATTVQFTLPSTYAAFAHYLTFPILPSHLLEDVAPGALRENSFSKSPVGSGPFSFRLLQDIDADRERKVVHLVRNNSYYDGAPKLERFQLDVFETDAHIVTALNTAAVNASAELSVLDAQKVNQNRYIVQRQAVNAGVYALLNTTSPLLQDIALRKALQAGTDTKALREVLGAETPELHLPFVSGQLTGDIPAAPVYDVTAANKMLDDAGWALNEGVRKKGDQTLRLNVVVMNNPDHEAVTKALVSQWQKLGVMVTTQVVNPSSVTERVGQNILQPRNFDVLVYQLSTGADPDVYAYWHSSQANQAGANYSNYNNALSDNTLASARDRVERDLRNAKYLTFARQWLADVPAIGLYQSTVQYVSNKNNRTVVPTDRFVSGIDRYAGLIYWTVNDRPVFTTP